ncbi:MAG TPA: glycogen debranching N-terminal domain-containing protein [Candidatus Binatia bacterium]|nr:glycogen debranching N-terminal domain-containing protein [Candidatus Binatia bacterium]
MDSTTQAMVQMEDPFYILATDSSTDEAKRVLKEGETFAVFDRHGDIQSTGLCQEGLYHEGTRFLSHLVFKLGNARPFLLNSTIKADNLLFVVNLTNPDIYHAERIVMPRGSLHISRTKLLRQSVCYETLSFINYGLTPIEVQFSVEFGADFADLFEVRGTTRGHRGVRRDCKLKADQACFGYQGLDGVLRQTRIDCSPVPKHLSAASAVFSQRLGPKEEKEFFLTYSCEMNDTASVGKSYSHAHREAEVTLETLRSQECKVRTSNGQFNEWIDRSSSDLHLMLTATPFGRYPYAGVPWFSTPFGRDGIITALEYLWVNPAIAKGVLAYLASMQATQKNADRDAEPGKILHETRKGEMAALGEIPFDLYYGSVDATPLFVVLAGAYFQCTGDTDFIKSIWPQIDLALRWMDDYGDLDGDGFIEYSRQSHKGLVHQGWKDSWDSISHEDGSLAQGPIALCEVQGYAYAARLAAAEMASAMGETSKSTTLSAQARTLKKKFHSSFWCDELSTFALALDGNKRQCRVRASNAGHCLYSGIADAERAARAAATLMAEHSFSGWGVRTLAATEARFNPMSYHNGSVWPHDNALIAAGLARYGIKEHAIAILSGLFEASLFVEYRLPELFCGFYRRDGEAPVPYPVACSPQAWAAGSIFLLLEAILGMKIEAALSRLSFVRPVLPEFLDQIEIKNLRVNNASVDLMIHRRARYATIEVEQSEGQVEVFTAT